MQSFCKVNSFGSMSVMHNFVADFLLTHLNKIML
jgi:hypothetical protein